MNNLVQIIHAIATAVSLRIQSKIADRVASIGEQISQRSPGQKWIDRAGFGSEEVNRKRVAFSQSTVDRATEKVEDLQQKHDQATDPKELEDYARRLRAAAMTLDLVTDAHKKLLAQIEKETAADGGGQQHQRVSGSHWSAGEHRVPGGQSGEPGSHPVRDAIRKASRYAKVMGKRAIGSKGRKAIKAFTPQGARGKLQKARATYNTAKTAHAAGKTAQTGKAVASAARGVAAARGMVAITEAIGALGAVAGPIGVAISAAVVVVSSALVFVNRQLAAGQQEIARFRAERSRFSADVRNSIAKYDRQSIELEQRSSQATGGSAAGVTKSTMALRESVQGRTQEWEDIGNKILASTIDVATLLNNILNSIDIVTPAASAIVGFYHDVGVQLGVLKEIEKNTRTPEVGADARALQLAMTANNNQPNSKKQNRALPPLK